MNENPSVLVVGRCKPSSDAPGIFSFVDTYTGKELKSFGLDHSVAQVIPLPFTDSTEQRLHLLIDTSGQAHLYPRAPEAVAIFQLEFSNIYWYSVEADNGVIKGHGLKSNCDGEVANNYCFGTREVWSIVFPSESEKIITTITRNSNEVVFSFWSIFYDYHFFVFKDLFTLRFINSFCWLVFNFQVDWDYRKPFK
jgi:hypothetical protein